MKSKKSLIGKKVIITSDNDAYANFLGKTLIIMHAANCGRGYDDALYPEMLCDFVCADGEGVPFSLYEYEFTLI